MTSTTIADVDTTRAALATSLRDLYGVAVHVPGDAGYDAARTPWNVAVDQRPAAVAVPTNSTQVAAVVRAAAAAGLRVAVQGTGHNAGPLGDLSGSVLLRTSAITGVTVDPVAGRARVGAGTLWEDVVTEATRCGVSVLHGSSPDVGVVGYSLGGGMGWYARALGLQTNHITAAEVVTADGSIVHADASHHADLFWALRGGGGNFGVVTELEFETFAFTTAYAGMLLWDWAHAARVLPAWVEWAESAPDSVTTSFRLLQLPPLPELPQNLRGRQVVVIDGAVLDDDDAALAALAPLRALEPELDTFARVASSSLLRLHMDPEGPTPAVSRSCLLDSFSGEAAETFLRAAGPGSGSSLVVAELRQLGGALSRPAPGAGALPSLDGAFVLLGLAIAATPQMAAQGDVDAVGLIEAMDPWSSGRSYLNFAETEVDPASAFGSTQWETLRAVRSWLDPHGLFQANHVVPVQTATVPE